MTTYQLYLLLLGYLTDLKCDNQYVIDALLELYKRADSNGIITKQENNHSIKEFDKIKLYFNDHEVCKFYCNGECANMNRIDTIICDDGHYNEHYKRCPYRDPEKKTLSEAIVKESED